MLTEQKLLDMARKHWEGIIEVVAKDDHDAKEALNKLRTEYVQRQMDAGVEISEAGILALQVIEELVTMQIEGVVLGMVFDKVCGRNVHQLAARALRRDQTLIAIGCMKGN